MSTLLPIYAIISRNRRSWAARGLGGATPVVPTGMILALGDSITEGTGATAGNSYVELIEAGTGWTISNEGDPGKQIGAISGHAHANGTAEGDLTIVLPGYNDMRRVGADVTGLDAFSDGLRAIIASKAVPDTAKTDAQSMTATGAWDPLTLFSSDGRYTSTIGRKLSFSASGTAVYVGWLCRRGLNDGGTFTIKVDGVLKATVDTNNALAGQVDDAYWPALTRIGGLVAGAHTVEIEMTGAGTINIEWGAGNNGLTPNPWVFCGNVLRMTTAGYATGDPYDNGSDEVVGSFNAVIESICDEFSGDGLGVYLVDTSAAYDPENVDPDNVHPDNAGHAEIAASFLAEMGY